MTSASCPDALEIHGRPPLAVCSLVPRVEAVELSTAVLRRELRSFAWRLSALVGAVAAISPHLVKFGEWFLAHLPPASSLVSLLW
jgi:hypothetical protein